MSSSELRVVLGRDKIPFYNDLLDKKQVKYLLKDIKFNNYKYRSGEESDYIQISDDEKWINIGGSILPLDFICGYNDAVKKFEVNEEIFYGSDEVMEFDPDDLSYSDELQEFGEGGAGYAVKDEERVQ